mmetsp:Transcript_16059/g.23004  ORF Transcript_16059/g.23004 Transcript_16059/m.23004 type:complete len:334 (+) Transcript_16059:12-1013(+)
MSEQQRPNKEDQLAEPTSQSMNPDESPQITNKKGQVEESEVLLDRSQSVGGAAAAVHLAVGDNDVVSAVKGSAEGSSINDENHTKAKASEEEATSVKRTHADTAATKPILRPIKKARTAYFIFAGEKRAEVQAANPGAAIGTLAKAIGQLWANLSAEEREVYQARAAEERERVSKEMEALREAGLLPNQLAGADGGGEGSNSASSSLVIPVHKIRKIAKLDPDVRKITPEATVLLAKCAELFTCKLGVETAKVAQMQNRRKLLPEDVAEVCSTRDECLFLKEDVKDLVREQEAERKATTGGGNSTSNTLSHHAAGSKLLTSYFSVAANGAGLK